MVIKRKRWSAVQPSCSSATDHATTFLVTQHLSLHMNLKQVFVKQCKRVNTNHGSVRFICGTYIVRMYANKQMIYDGFQQYLQYIGYHYNMIDIIMPPRLGKVLDSIILEYYAQRWKHLKCTRCVA